MEFINNRNNILFSLHDCRIKKMIFQDGILTIKLDKIFQYTQDGEKIYSGELVFYQCDLEECSISIFNRTLYEGEFSGKMMSMKEYIENRSKLEFEILTEGYYGYNAIYMGWIWEDGKEPVSAIMYIWNMGDMIYRINAEFN